MIEHITSNIWELWIIVAIICLIIEMLVIADGSLYVLCFAVGALVSAIASIFLPNIYAQIIIWAIASVLSIFLIRPILRRYFHHEEKTKASNADAIIGRHATVSEDIPADGFGRVALDGDDWKAESEGNAPLAKGTKVEIVARESIIVTVKKA